MKIVVKKEGKWFVTDRPGLAGSPTVGRGATRIAALGELLLHAQGEFGVEVEFDRTAQGRWPRRYRR